MGAIIPCVPGDSQKAGRANFASGSRFAGRLRPGWILRNKSGSGVTPRGALPRGVPTPPGPTFQLSGFGCRGMPLYFGRGFLRGARDGNARLPVRRLFALFLDHEIDFKQLFGKDVGTQNSAFVYRSGAQNNRRRTITATQLHHAFGNTFASDFIVFHL